MGRIDIILHDEMEEQFRNLVFKKYGLKRGVITKAIHEAIGDWIKKGEG